MSTTRAADEIIVVSGLPRSGTSLLMQVLEAGGLQILKDDKRPADEDNPRGYYEYEPVRNSRSDVSWVKEARGKVVKVIAPLIEFLPQDESYKIIYMQRNLDEVIQSQSRMLQRLGKQGAALPVDQLRQTYELLLKRVLTWIDGRTNLQCLTIDFNQMIGDCELAIESITTFLHIESDKGVMKEIVDPALYRQRC